MTINIRFRETQLTDRERHDLFEWDADVFQGAEFKLVWQPKTCHFLLYESTQLVSHVGMLKHQIVKNDKPLLVGGIGGVITVPEAQGNGYASILLEKADAVLAEWNVAAGLLFCRKQMQDFYAGKGWITLDSPVTVRQPQEIITMPVPAMAKPVGLSQWPPGAVHIPGYPW